MEQISITSISNAKIKVVRSGKNKIEFHERYLHYAGKTVQEENDDELNMPCEKTYHWDSKTLKEKINGAEVAWSNIFEVYQLIIKNSDNDNWVLEYKEENFDDALRARDKILDWLLQ